MTNPLLCLSQVEPESKAGKVLNKQYCGPEEYMVLAAESELANLYKAGGFNHSRGLAVYEWL